MILFDPVLTVVFAETSAPSLTYITAQMSENGVTGPSPQPGDRVAIGITFGNSNSSIAYTIDDKAEVIANEDGGECDNSGQSRGLS